ncbi:hypothetical protein GBAR_LOCUS849, partial [Geodia barretti]
KITNKVFPGNKHTLVRQLLSFYYVIGTTWCIYCIFEGTGPHLYGHAPYRMMTNTYPPILYIEASCVCTSNKLRDI